MSDYDGYSPRLKKAIDAEEVTMNEAYHIDQHGVCVDCFIGGKRIAELEAREPISDAQIEAIGKTAIAWALGKPPMSMVEVCRAALQQEGERAATDHDWPQDWSHENGQYENICDDCNTPFIGGKYRRQCRRCAALQQEGEG